MVYKWYILPIGALYGTYHLLTEPGNSIDIIAARGNSPFIAWRVTLRNPTEWSGQSCYLAFFSLFQEENSFTVWETERLIWANHHHSPRIWTVFTSCLLPFFGRKFVLSVRSWWNSQGNEGLWQLRYCIQYVYIHGSYWHFFDVHPPKNEQSQSSICSLLEKVVATRIKSPT